MPDGSSPDPARSAGARLRAQLPAKLAWQVAIGVLFWTGYGWLGRHAVWPVRTPPLTALDRAVDFSPQPWAWVYLSQFVLTGGLPWLIDTRAQLLQYVRAVALLSASCFLVFLLLPVASPRPGTGLDEGAMAWIVRWDGAYNAFPSLHAGFVVLMVALGGRLFRRAGVTLGLGVWGLLILYATLATRQHYAWDLAAGIALGVAADAAAGRIEAGTG